MKHIKKITLQVFLLFSLVSLSTCVFAQVTDPYGTPETSIPIDGGLSLILAGGIIYAGNELRLYVKKKRTV